MSDAELIEKVLRLKGWIKMPDGPDYLPPDSLKSQFAPSVLTSLDACHEVFEKDAEDGYWWKVYDMVCIPLPAEQVWTTSFAKATPRQRCEAFVAFMTGEKK